MNVAQAKGGWVASYNGKFLEKVFPSREKAVAAIHALKHPPKKAKNA